MHEPEWLVDLSYRAKVVAKPVYLLALFSNGISTCTKVDAIRFKTYYGYMIKTYRMKNISVIMLASNSFVEYLFDSHEYCDERRYRSKTKQNGKVSNFKKLKYF